MGQVTQLVEGCAATGTGRRDRERSGRGGRSVEPVAVAPHGDEPARFGRLFFDADANAPHRLLDRVVADVALRSFRPHRIRDLRLTASPFRLSRSISKSNCVRVNGGSRRSPLT